MCLVGHSCFHQYCSERAIRAVFRDTQAPEPRAGLQVRQTRGGGAARRARPSGQRRISSSTVPRTSQRAYIEYNRAETQSSYSRLRSTTPSDRVSREHHAALISSPLPATFTVRRVPQSQTPRDGLPTSQHNSYTRRVTTALSHRESTARRRQTEEHKDATPSDLYASVHTLDGPEQP